MNKNTGALTVLVAMLPSPVKRFLIRIKFFLGRPSELLGSFGSGGLRSYIDRTVQANYWAYIEVKKNCTISRGTQLHINFILRDSKQIIIGEGSHIGQSCFFSCGEQINIGSHCLIGANCSFLGAGHIYSNPIIPHPISKVESYGTILLGENVWMGTGATIIGDVSIGFGSIIGAASLVNKSLPPLSMAIGSPAKIVKLFNWHLQRWESIKDFEGSLKDLLSMHLERLPTKLEFSMLLKNNHK